jgi:hypothetical protein
MPKRIILCSLVFCMLLVLPSCGHAEVTAEDTLETMYSISKSFLNVHYSATVSQAEEYDQIHTEMINRVSGMTLPSPSGLYNSGLYSYEDLVPDLAEHYEALFKEKYQTQPLTDKGYSLIVRNSMPITLWKIVLKAGSDIEVTSVKTSLKNTDIDDKQNDINYTINLLINKASYEVIGVMTLVLVDNKWMIDGICEVEWSPKQPY